MSRKRTIALAGVILLGGLALIENSTRSIQVLPATVTKVTPEVPEAGPDLWTISFTLNTGEAHQLGPLNVRPVLQAGDSFCVRQHKRSWAAPKFQISADKTC
ncbi:hypothetical protein [Sulfitobacter donghicola]|uniref:Uncharacterized protein n=1 Tax=Sulfitobacter donghicola DSW-25 = KCTC 12864 = JCM 14565 TaxID=1300350 RepID=A0A073IJH3_9RHOB|nr:hypothetical protein [Sulfitobacter donghicola]KEJ89666.1 hypothetical protein DSW25_11295 [Sulfitobacter donghicola DSW-25 = KCTC 12864 = JCM 14565]KIN69404.1 hypothetical protein Z948_3145 [Sulfitobacter donghicola DSW-25 = KCTC 12864 = JCM 14565]